MRSELWSAARRSLGAARRIVFVTDRRQLTIEGRRWQLRWGSLVEAFDGDRYRYEDGAFRRVARSPAEAFGIRPRLVDVQLLEALTLREHLEEQVPAGVGNLAVDDEVALSVAAPERFLEKGKVWLRLTAARRDGRRRVIYLDPVSFRPVREEWYYESRLLERIDVHYDGLPHAPAPSSLPLVDMDRLHQRWLSQTIRTLHLAGSRFTVHDFQISASGEIFLLVTGPFPSPSGSRRLADGGFAPRHFVALAQDDVGGRYANCPIATLPGVLALPHSAVHLSPGAKAIRWRPDKTPRWPLKMTVSFIETWRERDLPRRHIERIVRIFAAPTCHTVPEYLFSGTKGQ